MRCKRIYAITDEGIVGFNEVYYKTQDISNLKEKKRKKQLLKIILKGEKNGK